MALQILRETIKEYKLEERVDRLAYITINVALAVLPLIFIINFVLELF